MAVLAPAWSSGGVRWAERDLSLDGRSRPVHFSNTPTAGGHPTWWPRSDRAGGAGPEQAGDTRRGAGEVSEPVHAQPWATRSARPSRPAPRCDGTPSSGSCALPPAGCASSSTTSSATSAAPRTRHAGGAQGRGASARCRRRAPPTRSGRSARSAIASPPRVGEIQAGSASCAPSRDPFGARRLVGRARSGR